MVVDLATLPLLPIAAGVLVLTAFSCVGAVGSIRWLGRARKRAQYRARQARFVRNNRTPGPPVVQAYRSTSREAPEPWPLRLGRGPRDWTPGSDR